VFGTVFVVCNIAIQKHNGPKTQIQGYIIFTLVFFYSSSMFEIIQRHHHINTLVWQQVLHRLAGRLILYTLYNLARRCTSIIHIFFTNENTDVISPWDYILINWFTTKNNIQRYFETYTDSLDALYVFPQRKRFFIQI